MRVFLSWSGVRSRALAELLHEWLPLVLQVDPWMSSEDIEKGERWADILGHSLEAHDVGVICVTPENTQSPWLLFEAGALSKDLANGRVYPLLLGISPKELTGPLSGFQATVIQKEDMLALTLSLGRLAGTPRESVVRERFATFWPRLESKVKDIARLVIPGKNATIQGVVAAFARHGLPEPTLGSQVYFGGGFESHLLYSTAVDVATGRLWIFGRKNRKFFDKEHRDFLADLPRRVAEGFDFRVLFLDPDAPPHVLAGAHLDDDFREQLLEAQAQALAAIKNAGLSPRAHCRKYAITRTLSLIVVDDAVLYAPIRIDELGRARRLTKAPFSVVNATSPIGAELVEGFDLQWGAATPLEGERT